MENKTKGLTQQIKEANFQQGKSLNLKDLEDYLIERLKNKPEDSDPYGLRKFPPRKLTWEEANAVCGISQEEYENSTGLYQIGYSLTGEGGFKIYQEELQRMAKQHLK